MNAPRLVSLFGGVRERLSRAFGPPASRAADSGFVATPENWQRLEDLLIEALELPTAERMAFLDRACAGEPGLRSEVDSLLAAHARRGLLDRPPGNLLTPLASLFPSADPLADPGGTISHYRTIEKLGDGGMSVLYKARDLRLERVVALKSLPPYLSADPAAKERFLVEARAAAALDHPNICTIHEIAETDDGRLFIAMPFYEGETLKQRISRGPLPPEQALDFAIQASRGLAEAHDRGIVHRDIKPANLMITTDGVLKILDFGIVKLADVSLTKPGATPGTVAYMSPEQARGEIVDPRTDIWSLGVVLYEMLTGERPFKGDRDAVILNAIQHAEPLVVHQVCAGVTPETSRVVLTALARDPNDRYGTVRELLADLERVHPAHRSRAVIPARTAAVHGRAGVGGARPRPSDVELAGVSPEGERRQVTLVVSSLSGYATLVERLVPERVEYAILQLREAALDVVTRHGGMINRFGGDEMVFAFGIPTTHEDDSHRAVRAALELHARVRELSAGIERETGQPICLHSGIDTGRVVAQPAEEGDQEYRVAGPAAQVAARLAAQAAENEIWISPECQRLVEPFFEMEAGAPLPLRDRAQPVIPHRVIRESGLRTRWESAEKIELTAYTGRDEELATLERCLSDAASGEGQLITIIGEAGLGKSRLLYELRRNLDPDEFSVLQGRCSSYGTGTAYLPFIEILRDGLHLADGSSDDERLANAVARIREINPELEEFIPLYLDLLSIRKKEYPIGKHLHGEQFRLAMQEALAAILTLRARRLPTVLLLEDWHWADDASHSVLKQVAEMVVGYPLLLVVTCRPGYGVEWGNPGRHLRIPLRPLGASSSTEILKSVLRVTSLPDELAALIHERTGGNPFFLEEICHTLVEEGTVRVDGEKAVLSGSLESLDLPTTVQAVIRTRLDRLNREAREALRLASVVGREFTRSILEKTLSHPDNLPRTLQALKAAGLIQQIRVVPDAAYRFKHVLTQEVAYASLLEHQRRELHGRVGAAIEALHGDRIEEHLERLAHHFSSAADWWKAVHYGIRSARRADALSQFQEALQLLERAQGWLLNLPENSERQNTLIEILFQQERVSETLGLRGRQQQIIDELITLVERSEDLAKLAEAYVRQGDLNTLLRQFGPAEEALNRSLRIRRELGDTVGERNTLRSLGLLRWHQGRNEEAAGYMEEALAIDRRRDDREAVLGDLSNLGYVLKGMGEYERARSYLEEALRLAESAPGVNADGFAEDGVSLKRSYVLHNLANVYRELGDNERALEYLQRSVRSTRALRLPIQHSYHYTTIAHIYLQQGKIEEGLQNYREAVDLTRKAKFASGLSQSLRFLGEVLLGLERYEEALPHLQEAAGLFAQLEDHSTEALLWGQAATAHEKMGSDPDALAAWSRVRTLSKQGNDRAGELRALEGIARVTRRHVGEPSLALGYFREAVELARELGDLATEGRLRNTMGILEWGRGEYGEALGHYQRALEVFGELGNAGDAGLMLNSIGATLKAMGNRDAARAHLVEAISVHRRVRQPLLEGHALAVLGDICREAGEAAEALEHYERSLQIRQTLGDRAGQGWMLHHIAQTSMQQGNPDRARGSVARASEIAIECGDRELAEACERLRRTPGL